MDVEFQDYFSIIGRGNLTFRKQNVIIKSPAIKVKKDIHFIKNTFNNIESRAPVYIKDKDEPGYIPGIGGFHPPTICILENEIFTTECVILKRDGFHLFKQACHPRYWFGAPKYPKEITFYKYKQVICYGHQHTSDWGHWSLEVLPGIVATPSNILSKSIIAVPFARDFVYSSLEAFGIHKYQIIEGDNMPLYAETLVVLNSTWCGDVNRRIILELYRIANKRFKLDSIKPTRMIIANRKQGMSRCIGNYDEIMEKAKNAFPDINWEPFIFYDSYIGQIKYFASMKFIFAVHGSLLTNIIFMKPNTIVVEMHMSNWLLSFIYCGIFTSKYHILGRDKNISYHNKEPNILNVNYCMKLFAAGLIRSGTIQPEKVPYIYRH